MTPFRIYTESQGTFVTNGETPEIARAKVVALVKEKNPGARVVVKKIKVIKEKD